ncbi:MAG: DUF2750 domain-containing protein [Planctomycetota bacterium]
MNDQEFNSILVLPGPKRYSYFVKRVVDWSHLYVLDDGGWLTVGDDDDERLLPVWSHPRFAMACASGEWSSATAKETGIQSFLEETIPNLISDGLQLAIMMTPGGRGVVVDPRHFRGDVEQELADWYE